MRAGQTLTIVADGPTHAVARRQSRLRPDDRPARGRSRHRPRAGGRHGGGGTAQFRPSRAHRRLGRARRRGRPGVDPFRQRLSRRAGGAVRRRRSALLHQPVLHRRAAAGRAAAAARLRDLAGRRGQGAGRVQRRQAGARGRADRAGRHALGRPAHPLRRDRGHPRSRFRQRRRRAAHLRRAQGLGRRLHVRDPGRLPDRRRHLGADPGRPARRHRQRHAVDLSPPRCASAPTSSSRRRANTPPTSRLPAPPTPGGEVLVPGEPEARIRAQRLRDGIPLQPATWAAIGATASALGVPRPA